MQTGEPSDLNFASLLIRGMPGGRRDGAYQSPMCPSGTRSAILQASHPTHKVNYNRTARPNVGSSLSSRIECPRERNIPGSSLDTGVRDVCLHSPGEEAAHEEA